METIPKHDTLEFFEDSLRNAIKNYENGECDLDDVLKSADRVSCYKANVGIEYKRLQHNKREQAFYEQWRIENAPNAWINCGHGILQDLFIKTSHDSVGTKGKVIEEISNRDRMIVATVIQWLGTNCGMGFLQEALKRFGARIVYDEVELKQRTAV